MANLNNFDAALYLAQNPDVAAAGVDPWQHYENFGRNEGRVATPHEVQARQDGYAGTFGGGGYSQWAQDRAVTALPPPSVAPPPPSGVPAGFNSLPGSGAVRDLKLPNGSTIQIREDDPDFARVMSQGAVDQSSPEAANYSWDKWYAPGAQGYLDAIKSGHNDPHSNPSAPQPFTPTQVSQAGVEPQRYADLWSQQHGREAPQGFGGGLLGGGGTGGLLGGGFAREPGGLLGGGFGGGTGGATIPGIGQFPGTTTMGQPASTTPLHSATWNPTGVQPTIPTFQQQPQTFDDILSKYGNYRVPMPTGGINWMSPSVSPGGINVMDANLSRRYL